MASRIIHLAITNELIKQYEFNDIERLRLGAIIPDGVSNRDDYSLSHFKLKINDDERTYDLTKFRNLFKDKMMTDDLYLGYYLHLIEDLIFRNFVYDKYKWDPRPEGNVERLYDDYKQINSYLINRYNIQNDILVPNDFEKEQINEVACFEPHKFVEEFKKDFDEVTYKERFFFTDNMAMEYISLCIELCKKELDALKNGNGFFNEYEWSWGK